MLRRRLYIGIIAVAVLVTFAVLSELRLKERGRVWNVEKKRGVISDYSKAREYLEKYKKMFDKNSTTSVDPSQPSTVETWWQAAAIIDAYTRSDLRYACKAFQSFGNWAACMDPPYIVKSPCLVYSFGIAWDYSFDDAMVAHGCEVHSFDPSMNLKDHQRSNNSYFYAIGLASYNTNNFQPRRDIYVKKPQVWKVRTLSAIKKMLGHEERTIDVLKLDIEGYEWTVLENLMESGQLDNVRQFSLEFHLFRDFPAKVDYVNFYKSYTALREDYGFLEYSVSPHGPVYREKDFNIQGDSQFVNSFFPYTSKRTTG
ncbi:methyltransferase-like protein 24 [Plakobranchus ocellatus]|uniref:Methyltransferase-like protein 24 n=1 Tax=Plakobranchus ocellatus TaxID=259542 RepID=A0AAV3YWT2_9GAST|nr:methyltransferase-like protein 24 [Plakobranchus ocellatus]